MSVLNFVTSGGVFSVLESVEMCDQFRLIKPRGGLFSICFNSHTLHSKVLPDPIVPMPIAPLALASAGRED